MPATQAPPANAPNRRAAPRRQATVGTVCRLHYGAHAEPHLGLVWNISSGGVSMFLNEPPERGIVLTAELATVDDRTSLPVTLRVVHVKPIRTGDFFLGAQFERPLAPEEIRAFVAEAEAAV